MSACRRLIAVNGNRDAKSTGVIDDDLNRKGNATEKEMDAKSAVHEVVGVAS